MTEATVGQWFKKVGDVVKVDEPLVELETDKVTLEVPAPSAGVIESIAVEAGGTVGVGALLGAIKADGKATPAPTGRPDQKTDTAKADRRRPRAGRATGSASGCAGGRSDARRAASLPPPAGTAPSAAKILAEKGISAESVAGTGKDGRITKADALFAKAAAAEAGCGPRARRRLTTPLARSGCACRGSARPSPAASRRRRTPPRCSPPSTRWT